MQKTNRLPKTVKEWLDKAAEDMKAAEILLSQDGPAAAVCFHAQ